MTQQIKVSEREESNNVVKSEIHISSLYSNISLYFSKSIHHKKVQGGINKLPKRPSIQLKLIMKFFFFFFLHFSWGNFSSKIGM